MRHVEPGIVVTISRSRLSLNTAASLRRLSGVDVEHCQCDACKDGVIHASDCAVHNEPAYRNGPCDCMAIRKGDTPETNEASRIALEWAESWYETQRKAFSSAGV